MAMTEVVQVIGIELLDPQREDWDALTRLASERGLSLDGLTVDPP